MILIIDQSLDLSFNVKFSMCIWYFAFCFVPVEMVRFELMTPCLQGRCSPN